jgi:predicted RNA-binding protein with PIN domain
MEILIDGHNLIPKIPGLSLEDLDDELKLVQMLQGYARVQRHRIEVIFDKAPIGQPRQRAYGSIQVRFARSGLNADEEIRLRLAALGSKAQQYLVVSSDNRVQTYARAARAKVENSETFAQKVLAAQSALTEKSSRLNDDRLDEQEIAMWMELFRNRPGSEKP